MQTPHMTTPTPMPYGQTGSAAIMASVQDANTQSSEISAFIGGYSTLGKVGINAANQARIDFLSFQNGIQQFGTQQGNIHAYRPAEKAVSHSTIQEFGMRSSSNHSDVQIMMQMMVLLIEFMERAA
jgi:hypothetical protein